MAQGRDKMSRSRFRPVQEKKIGGFNENKCDKNKISRLASFYRGVRRTEVSTPMCVSTLLRRFIGPPEATKGPGLGMGKTIRSGGG